MIWFTSDLHLGHENLASAIRPSLGDIDSHDAFLLDKLNTTVRADKDTLYILGDFGGNCRGNKSTYYAYVKSYRDKIRCKNIHFIEGNHDHEAASSLFASWNKIHQFKHNHNKFIVCHFPILCWNSSQHGSAHLHGHDHFDHGSLFETMMPNAKRLDVGVDSIFKQFGEYRPISIDEVEDYMGKRSGFLQRVAKTTQGS